MHDATVLLGARTGIVAADWSAAIRLACEPLISVGAAEPRYADRAVEVVQENGPYMVLAPGLALAHARPEDGALALGLTAITLQQAVHFGHADNDPVDLVFGFCSPDRDGHMELLSTLARQLSAGACERLRVAIDDEEAERMLHELFD